MDKTPEGLFKEKAKGVSRTNRRDQSSSNQYGLQHSKT